MHLQVAATDWLAVRVGAAGLAYSGINKLAALNLGATFGYSLVAGAVAGWRWGRLRIAASVDVEYDKEYNFNIQSAINDSLQTGRVNASTLLTDTGTYAIAPGAQIAYGLHPALGAFGHARCMIARAIADGTAQGTTDLELGGGLSVDLKPVTRVPLGFLAVYNVRLAFPTAAGAVTTANHQLGGGVFYTGRADLSLGAEVRASLLSPTGEESLTVIEGVFGLRYFW
jgi:hypothetical protein